MQLERNGALADTDMQRNATLHAPQLTNITGALHITSSVFYSLTMPELLAIGAQLTVTKNQYLEDLTLAALSKVGGALLCTNNDILTRISLASLFHVETNLQLTSNYHLETAEFLQLRRIGIAIFETWTHST